MANQIVVSSGAKVRDLNDVIIGTSGVLSSLAFNVANGVPKLDSNAKILVSQLPNSVMEYLGTWNASTNTPYLVNGVGNAGDVYLCNVAGTVDFGAGPISFVVSDQVIYSGSIWQKASGSNGTVTSIALSSTGNDAITITGSPVTTSGTINLGFAGTNLQYINGAGDLTTFPTLISSIGLSMPSAFSVANSPLTANGTIAVTGAGYPSQYIRGDGTLADFPTSGGGGSSVSYYLNGGTSQGTIGGVTYYEMSKTADTGTGVDFPKTGDGLIVSFLTDANDPAQLNIPAGNWNYEIYASMSSNGGTPQLYAELYVYNGTTFTLISTSSNEILYDGVNLNLYTFAMTVPSTTLALTDRLAIKLYSTNSGGKTTTVHTQDSHLCQIITTFSTGITALNGLTAQVQYFATGTSGTDFNISSTTATHTFNIPDASATARGLITTGTQTIAGEKTFGFIKADSGVLLKNGVVPTSIGYTGIGAGIGTGIDITMSGSIYTQSLYFQTSAAYIYTFPAATGTLALTSNLSSYVPYTGATGNVTLGTYQLTAGQVIITTNTSTYLGLYSTAVSGTNWVLNSGNDGNLYVAVSAGSGYGLRISNANKVDFGSTIGNGTYTYTLPSATGTLALISNLSSYLPLAGGIMSGQIVLKEASSSTDYTKGLRFPNDPFGGANDTSGLRLYADTAIGVEAQILELYITNDTTGASQDKINFSAPSNDFVMINNYKIWNAGNLTPQTQLNGTGFVKASGTTISYDNTGYLPLTGGSLTGPLQTSSYFFVNNGTGTTQIYLPNGSGDVYGTIQTESSGGTFSLGVTSLTIPALGTPIITWTSGQQVGINVTIPTKDFDVNGTARIRSTLLVGGAATFSSSVTAQGAKSQFIADGGASAGAGISLNTSLSGSDRRNWYIGTEENVSGDFAIKCSTAAGGSGNAGTTRLAILNSGNVLIGRTTSGLNNTEGVTISGGSIQPESTGYVIYGNRTTSDGLFMGIRRNNVDVGSITVTTATTSFNITSDYRLKQDLKEFSGLELISKIKTYDYQWKLDKSRMYGVIAHELEEVLPYAVFGKKDEINENGDVKPQAVDYSKLVPLLINAMQEQQAQIEELKQLILNK